jgi:hypothetical protein
LVADSPFPSDSCEKHGYFVGIAEHVGHAMMFKVLTDDTRKLVYHLNIRSVVNLKSHNLHLDPLTSNDESKPPIIKSHHDSMDYGEGNMPTMLMIDPHNLVGRTFLLPPQEDRQHF